MQSHAASSVTVELPVYSTKQSTTPTISSRPASSSSLRDQPNVNNGKRSEEGTLPSPTTASNALARCTHPRINLLRTLAALYGFILFGMNDGAYGALIPYLEQYYNVSYTVISLVFLSPVVGYVASALTCSWLHYTVGQRGIALILGTSHLIAYTAICLHPPYPVLILVFVFAGYGNGLSDSAWNAWLGGMANANEVLGILHGCYGLGAALSPLIATALITKAGWKWYEFYYIMLGGAVIEFATIVTAFWSATAAVHRAEHPQEARDIVVDSGVSTPQHGHATNLINQHPEPHSQSATTNRRTPWYIAYNPLKNPHSLLAEAVRSRVTLTTSFFLLIYVGAEVSIGGWIVTFMLRVRGGTPFASGLTSTGFWLGISVGRFVLGFVTPRLFRSEKHAIAVYLVICVALQLMFWLIPRFIVSAVMVGLLGFFLAPMFPASMVALTKLLPKRLHVASIGFAAALGAAGACVLPFAVGAIANSRGVQVLQPVILALLLVDLGIWLSLPKIPKERLT